MVGRVRTHVKEWPVKGRGQGAVPYAQEAPHLPPCQQLTLGSPAGFPNSISLSALPPGEAWHQKSGSLRPCCNCSLQVLGSLNLTTKVWTIPSELEQITFWYNLLLNRREKKPPDMMVLKSPWNILKIVHAREMVGEKWQSGCKKETFFFILKPFPPLSVWSHLR